MCLTCDEIERSWSGGTECRAEGVITHREIFRIGPECRDSVAIIVVHHNAFVRATTASAELNELVHQAMVEGLLFIRIRVILIPRHRLRAVESIRIGRIGVTCEQGLAQAIDRRRTGSSSEMGFSCRVLCIRLRSKIMVERDILLENDDEVLNRCSGIRYR